MDNEEEQAAALEKATATYTEHARQFRDFEKVNPYRVCQGVSAMC